MPDNKLKSIASLFPVVKIVLTSAFHDKYRNSALGVELLSAWIYWNNWNGLDIVPIARLTQKGAEGSVVRPACVMLHCFKTSLKLMPRKSTMCPFNQGISKKYFPTLKLKNHCIHVFFSQNHCICGVFSQVSQHVSTII